MDLNFHQTGNPNLTDLPAFNELDAELRRFLDGESHPDASLEMLGRLDGLLGRMETDFMDGQPFREDTPLAREAVPQVLGAFDRLRRGLPALQETLEHPEAVSAALEDVRAGVQDLCEGLARLRAEEEARERYSESPYVHELCRVGRAWLRGRLPQESFLRRLEAFEEYHRMLRDGLRALEPTPRERAVLEAGRERLESALDRQERAAAELRAALEVGDEDPVTPALEVLRAAAADLVDLHRALVEASERKDEHPCPRCGAPNAGSSRFCHGCGGVLPRRVPETEEVPRLDIAEGGAPARPQYENLVRLKRAIEEFRAGTLPEEDLGALLDELEGRVDGAEARLARMEPPSTAAPPEQVQLYQAARRAAEEGQERLREGLRLLRNGVAASAGLDLDRGLDLAWSAGASMADFERLYQEALAMAGQQPG